MKGGGFERGLLVGGLAIAAVLAGTAWLFGDTVARYRESAARVGHTHEGRLALEEFFRQTVDVQNGARGFVISGREEFLAPYEKARAEVGGTLRRVRGLTADSPAQQERCTALEALLAERLHVSAELIRVRRESGAVAPQHVVLVTQGKAVMDRVRALLDAMQRDEGALLARRRAEEAAAEDRARVSLGLLLGTLVVVLVGLFLLLRRELGRRSAAEVRTREVQARLQAILDFAPAVIFMKDPAGRYVLVNRAFERAAGKTLPEILGRTDIDITEPALAAELAGRDALVLAEGPRMFETTVHAEGRLRTFLSVRYPVRGANGEYAGIGGVATDITERKEAEEELRRAKEASEAALRELETFSYSVSHDLRTPLRAMDGFSLALLEDHAGSLDAQGKDYLGRVRSAAQRMAGLIDDLLEMSRVSRADLERGRVDLSGMARGVGESLRTAFPERKVEFLVEEKLVADADPRLLRVVLENLLGNAWKYTAKRAVARVEFGSEGDGGTRTYYVRDDGVGFDMRYAGKLFAPFQRLHRDEEFTGSGIGLATVQRVVGRHGGRVWAEAAPDAGATFRFTLGERR